MEEWKPIQGYEGLYAISSEGRIKSFRKWRRAHCASEYILTPSLSSNGYLQITLYSGKTKRKFLVHRLVAEAFVPNPDGLPHINHIDENTTNNRAANLEWCTPLYNNRYGTARFRSMVTHGTPIKQYLINGVWLATYASVAVAENLTGIPAGNIQNCLSGQNKTANGFMWSRE